MQTMKRILTFTLLLAASLAGRAQTGETVRPAVTGVSHMAFCTGDLENTRAFFKDYLGYEESFVATKPDGSTIFTVVKFNDRQFVELFPEKDSDQMRFMHFSLETTDAEAMRLYLKSKGLEVPESVRTGRMGNRSFTVTDPNGIQCEFIEYPEEGMTMKDKGKNLPSTRVSERMSHVGFMTPDLDKAVSFYVDILGFKEVWRGSPDPETVKWVHLQVPEGKETLELMLFSEYPSLSGLGSMNHICLEVSDIEKAKALLDGRVLPEGARKPSASKVGINRKRQLNYFNYDGTRVEIMEDRTVDGKPAPSSAGVPLKYVPNGVSPVSGRP